MPDRDALANVPLAVDVVSESLHATSVTWGAELQWAECAYRARRLLQALDSYLASGVLSDADTTGVTRQPSTTGHWQHTTDGSRCPWYIADRPTPRSGQAWWCTEHQSHLVWSDANTVANLDSTRAALRREIGSPTDRDDKWQPMVSAGEIRALLDALDERDTAAETVTDAEREALGHLIEVYSEATARADDKVAAVLAVLPEDRTEIEPGDWVTNCIPAATVRAAVGEPGDVLARRDADQFRRRVTDFSVDDMARALMAEWERVEKAPVSASFVATFADMARAALRALAATEATDHG